MTQANPIPQGKYVPANRFGDLIFTAGMTPRSEEHTSELQSR